MYAYEEEVTPWHDVEDGRAASDAFHRARSHGACAGGSVGPPKGSSAGCGRTRRREEDDMARRRKARKSRRCHRVRGLRGKLGQTAKGKFCRLR